MKSIRFLSDYDYALNIFIVLQLTGTISSTSATAVCTVWNMIYVNGKTICLQIYLLCSFVIEGFNASLAHVQAEPRWAVANVLAPL